MAGWRKLGRIFAADNHSDWMATHAMIPVAEARDANCVRIYFSPRDNQNRGHGAYLEIDMRNPLAVTYLHPTPILEPGKLGTFDDSGALPNAIVQKDGRKLLYYTGINIGVTVKIRNSIGLAEWNESEQKFVRCFEGPVIDRTKEMPHFVATPEVMYDGEKFRAWYTACILWEAAPEGAKHYYHLEYAESVDGVYWRRNGTVAIPLRDEYEYALGVPRVLRQGNHWQMWFCARATAETSTYRIHYAESADGIHWQRDPKPQLDVSAEGWDSEMVCYPFVFDHGGKRYMLYNGNGYGRTGFGIAVWDV